MITRTIKELLQVLLDNVEYFGSGLCILTTKLHRENIINEEEKYLIRNFIKENAPERYLFGGIEKSSYNWEYGEWPPRKEWLEQEIINYENKTDSN